MRCKNYKQAFTIVEVILFLAVTGLLFVALLGGTAASVRNQRYNDSVATFKNAMQEQYSLVSNVQNSRDLDQRIICEEKDGAMVPAPNGTAAPGMSNCLIYGRVVEFTNGGYDYRAANVIGLDIKTIESNELNGKTEKQIFDRVKVSIETANGVPVLETKQLEWGAHLRKPSSEDAAVGGLLILRSPRSGSVWTFNFETARDESKNTLVSSLNSSTSTKRDLCVASPDSSAGSVRAVVIGLTGGANSSAVQIAPLDATVNGVSPVVCNGNNM
ncbi:MAG: hypothetical protein LBG75_02035 [Candidatus Nomurabacteria bacterium]|nr:hypothetical protein [Candidatus Nomurabacteria bacterium]